MIGLWAPGPLDAWVFGHLGFWADFNLFLSKSAESLLKVRYKSADFQRTFGPKAQVVPELEMKSPHFLTAKMRTISFPATFIELVKIKHIITK